MRDSPHRPRFAYSSEVQSFSRPEREKLCTSLKKLVRTAEGSESANLKHYKQ